MQITSVPEGTIIDQPGLYRTPLEWYHQQCCEGPSFSSSGLRTIVNESPWHFWSRSPLNPDAYPQAPKHHFDLGKAAHALILGDEVFEDHYVVSPYSDFRTKDAKLWRDWMRAKGLTVITESDLGTIQYISENLARSPEAKSALTGDLAEISMIWQDEVTGLWIKSRPDMIPSDGTGFSDLKTTQDASKIGVQRAITKFRYDMQLALGVAGVHALIGDIDPECYLIFVQTSEPYTVTPVKLDADTIYYARCWNRKAIDLAAKCLRENHWPMPVEGLMEYTLPPSIVARYDAMHADNELPIEEM
jgi:hypothetical protein